MSPVTGVLTRSPADVGRGDVAFYQANSALNHPYGGIPKRQIGTGWQDFTQLALGDVTGDGLDDLIGVKADGSLWLAANP